jgi:hypothetical protein
MFIHSCGPDQQCLVVSEHINFHCELDKLSELPKRTDSQPLRATNFHKLSASISTPWYGSNFFKINLRIPLPVASLVMALVAASGEGIVYR